MRKSIVAGGHTYAQEAPISSNSKALLGAFVSSPNYRLFAEDAFDRIEPAPLRAECPHMTIAGEANLFTPVTEVSMIGSSSNALIANGSWISVIEFDRCGKRVKRRALMRADSKGDILSFRLVPGDFRGDFTLERDAMRIARPALMIPSECVDIKQFFVTDVTRKETKANGDWTEIWTASACGKNVAADVSYSQAPNGIVVNTVVHK
jgi:hypothetical protein